MTSAKIKLVIDHLGKQAAADHFMVDVRTIEYWLTGERRPDAFKLKELQRLLEEIRK